jgi:hypothetical protein
MAITRARTIILAAAMIEGDRVVGPVGGVLGPGGVTWWT